MGEVVRENNESRESGKKSSEWKYKESGGNHSEKVENHVKE